ncbi:hypothetical protein SDC9_141263 [bioreactor metagenome]|uniref:HPr domain-containing protein n=1 Tax=bioreactor metagenome TaxID=1076179 RepID=A0A645DX73_9ZZZZ|nr:HPr family phosphocarrier protein [Lachnospiraceae bacterium]
MVEAKTIIRRPIGHHLRSVSKFSSFVDKYNCSVNLIKENKTADAKSILNILALRLEDGNSVVVRVHGADEESVLKDILSYMEDDGESR